MIRIFTILLGTCSVNHHYCTFSWSLFCSGVDKKIFKGIIQTPPPHGEPCHYNFGRPVSGHHCMYCIHNFSDLCPGVEKKTFKEIHQFTPPPPEIIPFEGGFIRFTMSCLLTLKADRYTAHDVIIRDRIYKTLFLWVQSTSENIQRNVWHQSWFYILQYENHWIKPRM